MSLSPSLLDRRQHDGSMLGCSGTQSAHVDELLQDHASSLEESRGEESDSLETRSQLSYTLRVIVLRESSRSPTSGDATEGALCGIEAIDVAGLAHRLEVGVRSDMEEVHES
jgi:hypothetical protein